MGQQLDGPAAAGLELADALVSSNRLSGLALPHGWEQLRILTALNASSNALAGPLLPVWTHLRELNYMDFGNNMLTGLLPQAWDSGWGWLGDGFLYLAANSLSGPLPQWRQIKVQALHSWGATG